MIIDFSLLKSNGKEVGRRICAVENLSQILYVCRPDYISPLDDLAFDMYQDAEIAQIIRKLEKKKQEAVMRMYSSCLCHPAGFYWIKEKKKKATEVNSP